MQTLDEQTVRNALSKVMDPELGASVIDLSMIRQVSIEGDKVTIDLVLTVQGCPLAGLIIQQIRQAVGELPGVSRSEVRLLDEPWQPDGNDWQSWIR